MKKISIIIPVYNSEKYLDRTIKSVLRQSLEEIEVILVNDGSTDNSLQICKKYQKQDDRIVLIDSKNEGVSSARNKGLQIAKGKYVAFVDSDDYVEKKMYENMYNIIEVNNADMCVCNYMISENEKTYYINNKLQGNIIDKSDILEKVIADMVGCSDIQSRDNLVAFRGPCVYLYKNHILQEKKIKFNDNLIMGEDFLFNIMYMLEIDNLAIDREYNYCYCKNENSATQRYNENWWRIYEGLILSLINLFNEKGIYLALKKRLDVMIIKYFISIIAREASPKNNKKYIERIKYLRQVSNNYLVNNALETIELSELKLLDRGFYYLLKNKKVVILYNYYKVRLYLKRS